MFYKGLEQDAYKCVCCISLIISMSHLIFPNYKLFDLDGLFTIYYSPEITKEEFDSINKIYEKKIPLTFKAIGYTVLYNFVFWVPICLMFVEYHYSPILFIIIECSGFFLPYFIIKSILTKRWEEKMLQQTDDEIDEEKRE
jgi:hypothetical protein